MKKDCTTCVFAVYYGGGEYACALHQDIVFIEDSPKDPEILCHGEDYCEDK